MGNILQFPKIHKQYQVKATGRQINHFVYLLHLHKEIGRLSGASDIRYWQKVYRKYLKDYSYIEIRDAFDRCILDSSAERFPDIYEFEFHIQPKRFTSLEKALDMVDIGKI